MEKDKQYEDIGEGYAITTYDLGHKIGRGSFADVYKCHKIEASGRLSPEVLVAKRVYLQKQIPNMKELIQREITLMFNLVGVNPFVARIHHYFQGKKADEMFIIMECCEGGDLEKYIEEVGPLPEAEIADLLRPVVECFVTLHENNIIHRDLKLANILLTQKLVKGQKPELRITDFGLAYELNASNIAFTQCGTPLYMAPEIWENHRSGYTNKIDVWSFGNMLYKMMYGEYLFEDVQVEKKVREGILKFPKLRFTSLECLDLMLKCFRKDPAKRISFRDIAKHPFFDPNRKFTIFEAVFDGYFGYFETNIVNEYDLIANPKCLGIPEREPDIFELHNAEVLKELAKAEPHK